MATNFNDTLLPPPGYVEYQNEFFFALPFFMHFVLFFIMVASALLDVYFLIILLGRKQLRAHKENIIFSGNILFDLFHHINGASVHFNVFWPIVTHVKYVPLITPFDCLKRLPGILVFLTMPGSGTIVFATTVDRLIAVVFPLRYIRLGRTYAFGVVAAAYSLTFPTLGTGLVDLFRHATGDVIPSCMNQYHWITPTNFAIAQFLVVATTAAASVLHVPILYKIYRLYKHKQEYALINSGNRAQLLRSTITVMLLMLSHLGFLAFPEGIFALLNWESPWAKGFSVFAYIVRMMKGAVDIPVYFAMYPELRRPFHVPNVALQRLAVKPGPSWPLSPQEANQPRAPSQSGSVTLF